MGTRLHIPSGGLASLVAVTLLACSAQSSKQDPISESVIKVPVRGDSAWAVMVATGRFAARAAGDGPQFVEVTEYRRDGEDHLLTFSSVEEFMFGGGGVVRVRPDGSTSIAVIQ